MIHVEQKGKTESLYVRLSPEDRALLERMAELEYRTMTQVVEMALKEHAARLGYIKTSTKK